MFFLSFCDTLLLRYRVEKFGPLLALLLLLWAVPTSVRTGSRRCPEFSGLLLVTPRYIGWRFGPPFSEARRPRVGNRFFYRHHSLNRTSSRQFQSFSVFLGSVVFSRLLAFLDVGYGAIGCFLVGFSESPFPALSRIRHAQDSRSSETAQHPNSIQTIGIV
jgi:hypothetical protein